jgi:predicted negative regulator of RcsB-dependent stress response
MTTNGVVGAVRSKANWYVVLVIFAVGVTMGWIWTSEQNRCEQLAAERSRLIGMFTVAAEAAQQDGNPATAKVFQAYSSAAKGTTVPNC